MFKSKAILLGIILALSLVHGPSLINQTENQYAKAAESSDETSDDILGYYELDGGETVIPIREEKGVAERIPHGTKMEELMAAHRMAPEAEATIIHEVPPMPFILDGVQYEPEQIHLFDGKQLGFTVGSDGRLYAFTSFAALEDFMTGKSQVSLSSPSPEYSIYYDHINYEWDYRMLLLPNTTLLSLSYMDDMISSMKISSYATLGSTLFEDEDLQGDYFAVDGGTNWPNLGSYGWNDRASSLVVWP